MVCGLLGLIQIFLRKRNQRKPANGANKLEFVRAEKHVPKSKINK